MSHTLHNFILGVFDLLLPLKYDLFVNFFHVYQCAWLILPKAISYNYIITLFNFFMLDLAINVFFTTVKIKNYFFQLLNILFILFFI